jgi:hypothetical protein
MKYILAVAIAVLSFSSSWAQTDELALIQKLYGMEKRAMIAEFMQVSEAEKAAFWEVYDAYEVGRKELADTRFSLLERYANQYETLTDEQTDQLVKESVKMNMSMDKLKKKYYAKMKKATSTKTAAKFLQFENYLGTAVRFQILDSIPFVGEYDN